jgi:hypothetical protein
MHFVRKVLDKISLSAFRINSCRDKTHLKFFSQIVDLNIGNLIVTIAQPFLEKEITTSKPQLNIGTLSG